ncbi:hypothetical protein SIN8267_00630 [Sinobacterium norvegicum]|uniref:RND efflux pump membrane fusion protein barrel-sandwich domain-containing protein n=1 Tax=Sinobacterium norvegicum TaxID=1641715 RepID=A0ABM9ACB4_9GAMM|nr:efflux RND transporter periplasmic adaptor subunit [Sinobacterium norvegicum]CAH0990538.1 hypothetical protein SIN8267_00630 [Sinobacterium norvegicum]
MNRDNTTQGWLQIQCRQLPDVVEGVVILGHADGQEVEPVACWPEHQQPNTQLLDKAYAHLNASQTRPQFHLLAEGQATVCSPIIIDQRCYGSVCLRLHSHRPQTIQFVSTQLFNANDWFHWLAGERQQSRQKDTLLQGLLESLAYALNTSDDQAGWQPLVNSIAQRIDCNTVQLVLHSNAKPLLLATSQSQSDSYAQQLLLAAHEELARHVATIATTSKSDEFVRHQTWLRHENQTNVLHIPLFHQREMVASLALSGTAEIPSETVRSLEQLGLMLAPIIHLRLPTKTKRVTPVQYWHRFTLRSKWLASAALMSILLLLFTPMTMYVDADATVVSEHQRQVSVSADGFLQAAHVRPGDQVMLGQLLATLDTSDLLLERNKWQAKHRQYMKAYDKALAQGKRDEINIAKAQLAQAQAQLNQLAFQLERSEIRSPITGVVLSGELNTRLGAPVSRGEALYVIGPIEPLQLQLRVDEKDIALIDVGQHGDVLLTSIPGTVMNLSVSQLSPVAVVEGGRSFYPVEAALANVDQVLTVGMTGVGRVAVGQKPLWWRLSHRFFQWFSVWWWQL